MGRGGPREDGRRRAKGGCQQRPPLPAVPPPPAIPARPLTRVAEATRSHQKPSEATRSHQKPSEAIRSHQPPAPASPSVLAPPPTNDVRRRPSSPSPLLPPPQSAALSPEVDGRCVSRADARRRRLSEMFVASDAASPVTACVTVCNRAASRSCVHARGRGLAQGCRLGAWLRGVA